MLAFLVLVFWVILVLDCKRRWPTAQTLPAVKPSPDGSPAVARDVLVVIPARNEAESLPQTLPSLLQQSNDFARLVVVDDGSTDGTEDVVRQIAATCEHAEKVSVLSAPPRPHGWSPKVHALASGCRHGADDGSGAPPEWLLFTDADIRHSDRSIARLVAKATEEERDLVSIMVRLATRTLWEKLLIPPFVYFFQLLYPFRRVGDPRSRVAAAAGGCVLVRRAVFERAGGFERMRGAIIDDVTLARGIKKAGGRLWLGLDRQMVSVRGYSSLSEIVHMVARNAFTQLGYRYSLVPCTLAFLALFFVSPPILLVVALWLDCLGGVICGACAWGLQAWSLSGAVRHHGVPAGYAMTLPLAAALYGYMTAYSAWRYLRTGRTQWKDRALPP